MRCELWCDLPPRPVQRVLDLPAGATVAEALRVAAADWSGAAPDWARVRTGVWGVEVTREHALADGDRLELYRELLQDPREARRRRSVRKR